MKQRFIFVHRCYTKPLTGYKILRASCLRKMPLMLFTMLNLSLNIVSGLQPYRYGVPHNANEDQLTGRLNQLFL